MQLSDKKATLSFSDGSTPIEFPVYQGTIGPDVIDIRFSADGDKHFFTFKCLLLLPLYYFSTISIGVLFIKNYL